MLVLHRDGRDDERLREIVVVTPGGDVTFRVVEVDRTRVKIGVTAPREYPVWRGEILDRIRAESPAPPLSAGPCTCDVPRPDGPVAWCRECHRQIPPGRMPRVEAAP